MDRPASLLVLLAGLAALPARADVAPFGWRPRPRPVEEHSHVVAYRERLRPLLRGDERTRFDAHPVRACRVASDRGGLGPPRRTCPSGSRIRAVAADRGVRWLAAVGLDALGRTGDAARLTALSPVRDEADRRAARRALMDVERRGGSAADIARAASEILAAERSLEQLGVALADLVAAVLDAGADRGRVLAAAAELPRQLTRPLAGPRFRVEVTTQHPRGERHELVRRARRASDCVRRAFEASWSEVDLTVGLLHQGGHVRAHAQTDDAALRACVEHATSAEPGRLFSPAVVRLRYEGGVLWSRP